MFSENRKQEKMLSPEFEFWKADGQKLKDLLEGSHFFTEPWNKEAAYEGWEKDRRFIIEGINKNGTLLDFGCANGFLLRSLQEWSEQQIEPYGFDIDSEAIKKARELFPDKPEHFTGPGADVEDFPKDFDFVYWNVWDAFEFTGEKQLEIFQKVQSFVKKNGRLIMGFYDADKEDAKRKIKILEELGLKPTQIIDNLEGNQMLAIFDKVSQENSEK
jgi:cyclopropane fatty-acyl-phospholipid synthase-like methyltransferase